MHKKPLTPRLLVLISAVFVSAVMIGCGSRGNTGEAARADEGQFDEIDTNIGADSDINTETDAKADTDINAEIDGNTGTEGIAFTTEQDAKAEPDIDEISHTDAQGNAIAGFGDKATMNHDVGGRELPIYCVDTEEKKVALSFDAAWGNEDTAAILEILKEHDTHVTFFMTGGWVESYPEDVKAILAAGHDLGNHSENHKNMSKLTDDEKTEELMAVHRKVKELTGYDMFLFRPPYGDYDNDVINVAKDCGYYAIQWDVDSLDWQNKGVSNIIKTVTEHKNLGDGSIILCHNGAEYTAEALNMLLDELEGQGYEVVPISELIYRENFHLNYEGRQIAD